MIADEVTITVPSERSEHASPELMAKVYALARVVEDETGLEGYDPQVQVPVSDVREPTSSTPEPAPAARGRGWKFWKW